MAGRSERHLGLAWLVVWACAVLMLSLYWEALYDSRGWSIANGGVGAATELIPMVLAACGLFLVGAAPQFQRPFLSASPRFESWRLFAWILLAAAAIGLLYVLVWYVSPPAEVRLDFRGNPAPTEGLELVTTGYWYPIALGALVLASSTTLAPGWIGRFSNALVEVLRGLAAPAGASGQRTRPPRFKRCPDCAERVQAAAKVCKHCGHRFEQNAAP